MATIHVSESTPVPVVRQVQFTLQGDEQFTLGDLQAVQQQALMARFTRDHRVISLAYDPNDHPAPMQATLKVLKRQYPGATFTTYDSTTWQTLGSDVELLSDPS